MFTVATRNSHRSRWYLQKHNIRGYNNAHWTAPDRALIYKLREQEVKSIDEIRSLMASRLGVSLASKLVSRTRIYNQIRISKSVVEGRCIRCRKKLQHEDLQANKNRGDLKICAICMESDAHYKRTKRKKALKREICGVCQRRKTLPGHASCKHCLSYVYRIRIAKGLCGSCGKEPINKSRSKALGNNCLNANLIRSRARRED